MGRGRAKAKQTKVARELKYDSGDFDATRLQKELGHADAPRVPERVVVEEKDDYSYYDKYAEDDEGTPSSRR